MKAAVTLLLITCSCISISAQNLVINPSLESYTICPGFGQFSSTYIDDWDKPSYGSTDYYHYNCPGIIPTQQVPRSGDAYAGIICYNYGTEYREYMTGTLSTPLIPGATYYCEFYVSLNDGYIQAIKEIGAHFSVSPPGPYPNALHIPLTPQIVNTVNLLDDTSTWMRVNGYFLATGGEQYITIGNFYTDTNTTIVQVGNVGSYGSYYFVDDVWVSLSEGVGITSVENSEVSIYPNPAMNKLTIKSRNTEIKKISIFNSVGKNCMVVDPLILKSPDEYEFDLGMLPPGIYIAEIICGDRVLRKKIIRS